MTPSTTLSWRVWVNSHAPAAPVRLPSSTKTDREAEHEEHRAEHQPAAARLVEVATRDAGGVGQVARQQRDHARAEERDQAGGEGDRQGQHHRAGQRRLLEPVTHRGPPRRARPGSAVVGTRPLTDAATRPSASRTTRARDGPRRQRAGEREQRRAVGGVDRGVGHVEVADVGRRVVLRGVADVEADELHVVAQRRRPPR